MRQILRDNANLIALLAILLLIVALELVVRGQSIALSPENLSNLSLQVTITSVLAVGMTFVILIGGVDLGVGSLMALFGVMYLQIQNAVYDHLRPSLGDGGAAATAIALGMLVAFGAALVVGLFNGMMIGRFLIPAFVITLGVLSAARGGALLLSGATGLSDHTNVFKSFGSWYLPIWLSALLVALALAALIYSVVRGAQRRRRYGLPEDRRGDALLLIKGVLGLSLAGYVFLGHKGIPAFILLLALVVGAASFVLRMTPFGRRVYAIGGNEQAARLSGVNVLRVRVTIFTAMALLACVAGLLNASRSGGVSPGVTGLMAELDAIAAVVIGGTSLMGGVGTVEGAIVGALIIGVLRNGMTLLGVDANWEYVVRGAVVALAVWFDISAKARR
ncbi:MAG: inner-membrane translocator [Deltaproteobacteria bacterium]|nr:inner-membrane translocator [Deltaproteobacteria bacterium]